MDNLFKGLCFDKKGRYTPAVTLNDVPMVIDYCKTQGPLNYEVRITDYSENDTVIQVINGVVFWPEELKGRHVNDL